MLMRRDAFRACKQPGVNERSAEGGWADLLMLVCEGEAKVLAVDEKQMAEQRELVLRWSCAGAQWIR